jgi:hypothetical protein
VVGNIRHGAWPDADRDRKHAYERAEQCKRLGGEADRTCLYRPNPGQNKAGEENEGDYALGD